MVSSRFIFASSQAYANKKVGFRPLSSFVRQVQYNKETDSSTQRADTLEGLNRFEGSTGISASRRLRCRSLTVAVRKVHPTGKIAGDKITGGT